MPSLRLSAAIVAACCLWIDTAGCSCAESVDPCQPQNHCERDEGGDPRCVPGYRWRNPDDLDDYTCVPDGTPDGGAPDVGSPDLTATDQAASDTGADGGGHDRPATDQRPADTTRPDQVVPDTAVPDTAAPDNSAPDNSAPDTAAPDNSAPDNSAPDHRPGDSASGDTGSADAGVPACPAPGWSAERLPIPHAIANPRAIDLVFDGDGAARVALLVHIGGDPGFESLWYADNASGAWAVEEVDGISNGYAGLSIAVDSVGIVRIGYTHYEMTESERRLIHTTNAAGNWDRTVVPGSGPVEAYFDLTLDASGHPLFSYMADEPSGPDTLSLATWVGSEWSFEAVVDEPVGNGILENQLLLDSSHDPHILYRLGAEPHYAWRSTSWSTETVGPGIQCSEIAFALDDGDRPHLAYSGWQTADLGYGVRDGLHWTLTDVTAAAGVATAVGLALDGAGRPHVSHHDPDAGDLLHTYLDDGGRWQLERVACDGDVGWPTSIGVAPDGTVFIVYGDETREEVWVTRRTP